MKVLFISRKYPPQIGGMERYSYNLIKHFPGEKEKIVLKRTQKHLVWFLPYALIKGLAMARAADLVYLCDGLLSPIGYLVKKISGKPVIATIHGLDITYNNLLYQKVNVPLLNKLDGIIAVSRSTLNDAIDRGINPKKCFFIPNGIEISKLPSITGSEVRQRLEKRLGVDLNNKTVLLTVGRMIKRKGVQWFIENVFQKLQDSFIYCIVGVGKERVDIKCSINRMKLEKKVFLLGQISDEELNLIYYAADLFVMPNISVPGDREGFGIVALEASIRGLPVVASDLEGIRDAVHEGRNGYLVQEKNVTGFSEMITKISKSSADRTYRDGIKEYTRQKFSWDIIIEKYKKVIETFIIKS